VGVKEDADFATPSLHWDEVHEEHTWNGRWNTETGRPSKCSPNRQKAVESESDGSEEEAGNMVEPVSCTAYCAMVFCTSPPSQQ
jgi:hypothetical protein